MSENAAFNKRIFALLLSLAKGKDRSWRQFAAECDISYVQMRKLATEQQDNPPRDKLMQKLAQNAVDGITLADFRFAAGAAKEDARIETSTHTSVAEKEARMFCEKYLSLSKGQRSMVNAFIDFLSDRR